MIAEQLLCEQSRVVREPSKRTETEILRRWGGRGKWWMSRHIPFLRDVACIELTYEVTTYYSPAVHRLFGKVFDPRALGLRISRQADPPWDLFAKFHVIDENGGYSATFCVQGREDFKEYTPRRVREDGMVEEAIEAECIVPEPDRTERLLVSERFVPWQEVDADLDW